MVWPDRLNRKSSADWFFGMNGGRKEAALIVSENDLGYQAGRWEPRQKNQKGRGKMDNIGNENPQKKKEGGPDTDTIRLEIGSLSKNEEFARVVIAVFMSRMNPTLEEIDDVKTAVSEAVTNAVIHGYRKNPGIIYIEAAITGQELTIIIKDNGSGIHPEDLYYIFKRFYRSRYSKDTQGTGLGLPLAKSIIEAHGGSIAVDSELGDGTIFYLYLIEH